MSVLGGTKRKTPTSQAQPVVAMSSLIAEGLPLGMVLFTVGDDSSRLAVLSKEGLRIFRPDEKTLIQEFVSPNPEPVPWDSLQTFPARMSLFGVVLFSSEDYSYSRARVICMVEGRYQTVFDGSDVNFVDVNNDGVPEILAEDSNSASRMHMWAWDGARYVDVAQVEQGRLYAPGIIEKVNAISRNSRRSR